MFTDEIQLSEQGCFADKNESRDLDVVEEIPDMTVSKCIELCNKKGYRYAGLQVSLRNLVTLSPRVPHGEHPFFYLKMNLFAI